MSNEPNDNQVTTLEVEAPIVAVTVYTDRAQITRRGKVAIEATGPQELVIGGLPSQLDSNSLRASGRGVDGVTIVSVESKERFLTDSPHPATRELQEKALALINEDKALVARNEALTGRLEIVQKLADNAAERYARALSTGAATLEAFAQLLDFVSAQVAQVQDERAAVEDSRREVAERQLAVQNQLKQLQGSRNRRDYSVSVLVEALAVGEFELELLYVVPDASWQPLYDARLTLGSAAKSTGATATDESEGTLALAYLASLTQDTGEDWNGVALTLSTAHPNLGSLPPKLQPHYVDMVRPVNMPMARGGAPGFAAPSPAQESASGENIDEMLSMRKPIEKDSTKEATIAQATVETKGAAVTFGIRHPMSVPSDSQPHRSTIALHEFPARLDYRAVPERTELCYLRAVVQNESELSLLTGPVNIFRDGVFVGSSNLEAVAPGQEFKLFLGPDEQVKAERELTRRDVDKNLIGNVRRHSYAYLIKLENLKPHRVQLTVLDQIPVSRHEQIKVKLRHAEPEAHLDDLGELRWDVTLAPGGKLELNYEYVVESPRDMALSGLDD